MSKKHGYWAILGELFWASFKVTFILALLFTSWLVVLDVYAGKNIENLVFSIPLIALSGVVFAFPLIFIMAAVVGTPICMLIYKLKKGNMVTFIICGGIVSFITMNYPFFKSELLGMDEAEAFTASPILFLAGALTGYFFYKQMEKRSIAVKQGVDDFED